MDRRSLSKRNVWWIRRGAVRPCLTVEAMIKRFGRYGGGGANEQEAVLLGQGHAVGGSGLGHRDRDLVGRLVGDDLDPSKALRERRARMAETISSTVMVAKMLC
jgi:hypothetical protein